MDSILTKHTLDIERQLEADRDHDHPGKEGAQGGHENNA
jgi:hypothetical protein